MKARFFASLSWMRAVLFGGAMAFAAVGCKTTGSPASRPKAVVAARPVEVTSAEPKRFVHVPSSKPTTAQKWNPAFWLGNIDDPVPPHWYRPENRFRQELWDLRNPLHNFFFYVIGIADREFEIVGRVPGEVFNPEGGWNWTVCRAGWVNLPFISYKRGHFYFYIGWRNRGNFGAKLNVSKR
jgi:hypothetical protein